MGCIDMLNNIYGSPTGYVRGNIPVYIKDRDMVGLNNRVNIEEKIEYVNQLTDGSCVKLIAEYTINLGNETDEVVLFAISTGGYPYGYVYNISNPWCSEFGTVDIRTIRGY